MAFIEFFFETAERYSHWTLVACGFLAYILAIVIYRLYWSPIAKFPGPMLTATTSWYQFYHDVIKGGDFPFVIQKWHEKYGPALSLNSTNPT